MLDASAPALPGELSPGESEAKEAANDGCFRARARAFLLPRLAFLAIGLAVACVPGASLAVRLSSSLAVVICLFMIDAQRKMELRQLSRAARELAVVEERNRISREIHDGLGGVLSSVVVQSDYLLSMIDGSEVRARLTGSNEARAAVVPALRKEISDLHAAAAESMEELRRSLRVLREDFDLAAALGDFCRLAASRHRLDVRFASRGCPRAVGPESAFALLRVAQEALTNVAKHCGRGTQVEVTLAFASTSARLTIQDRGKGFALPADASALVRGGHYGLANLRERARKVSGRISISSAPGQGTRIELTVNAGDMPT